MNFNLDCPVCEHIIFISLTELELFCPQCETLLEVDYDYTGEFDETLTAGLAIKR